MVHCKYNRHLLKHAMSLGNHSIVSNVSIIIKLDSRSSSRDGLFSGDLREIPVSETYCHKCDIHEGVALRLKGVKGHKRPVIAGGSSSVVFRT